MFYGLQCQVKGIQKVGRLALTHANLSSATCEVIWKAE